MYIYVPRYADDVLVVVYADRESLSPLSLANSPPFLATSPLSVANSPLSVANSPLLRANSPLSLASSPLSRANSPPQRESLQLLLLAGGKKCFSMSALLRSPPLKKEENCLHECALGTEMMRI